MNPMMLIMILLPQILTLIPLAEKLFTGKKKSGAAKKKYVIDGLMRFWDAGITSGTIKGEWAAVPKASIRKILSSLIDSGVSVFNILGSFK